MFRNLEQQKFIIYGFDFNFLKFTFTSKYCRFGNTLTQTMQMSEENLQNV